MRGRNIVFEDDRMAYFGAMEAWDADRNLDSMRTFLKVETIRTWGGHDRGEAAPS